MSDQTVTIANPPTGDGNETRGTADANPNPARCTDTRTSEPPPVKGDLRRAMDAPVIERGDDAKTPHLIGYAAKTGVWTDIESCWGDSYREQIAPGAFKKTLADGADVRSLMNHDANLVLGRTKAGTLELREDETGLWYDNLLDPAISYVADAIRLVERGDISGSSFAFRGVKYEWDEDKAELIWLECALRDVSPVVTYPAYDITNVAVDYRALEIIYKRAEHGDADALSEVERIERTLLHARKPAGTSEEAADHLRGHEPDGTRSGAADHSGPSIEMLRLRYELLRRKLAIGG